MTTATTSSLSVPADRVSAMTAIATDGEEQLTTTAESTARETRTSPEADGRIGSHGHASQNRQKNPTLVRRMLVPPTRSMPSRRGRRRATLISSPAMKAISTTARPLKSCSSRAMGREMMLVRYGPQAMPNSR
jgi:hypothetical protein